MKFETEGCVECTTEVIITHIYRAVGLLCSWALEDTIMMILTCKCVLTIIVLL
jgi:hypothetical protein